MLLNKGCHHLAIGGYSKDGGGLILSHKATIIFDIGTEDSGELPLETFRALQVASRERTASRNIHSVYGVVIEMYNSGKYVLCIMLLLTAGCTDEELTSPENSRYITAEDELEAVLEAARHDKADSELAGIYARNIGPDGTIDLLRPEANQMFYITQSASDSSNAFYVAIYKAGPTKLPFDINTLIGMVQDTTARNVLETAFQLLGRVHIDPSVHYSDSDAIMTIVSNFQEADSFYTTNEDAITDLYLIPSITLSVSGTDNSADWIANLRSETGGNLVLHINTQSGNQVTIISR